MTKLVETAYTKLYPNKIYPYIAEIKYSGKFKAFNANVKKRGNHLIFGLAKDWKTVDAEIKIGVLQDLLMRLEGKRRDTENTKMYNTFIEQLSKVSKDSVAEPLLKDSFTRINDRFFYGIMNQPHLEWGGYTYTKFGSYHYSSDTISISRALEDDFELLDYVMYHEMLHKKHSFTTKNGRSRYHTKAFRGSEKAYPNQTAMEERLKRLARRKRSWF